MPARLTVYLADRPARVLVLREEEEYVLGRDATSTLVVDDDRVSRRHARLRRGREGWELSDLASKNGTLVNGQPVAGRALLAQRGWLSLGGVLAAFEPLTEEQSRAESSAQSERRRSTIAARRRLAAAHSLDQLGVAMTGEVLKGRSLAVFFAHEKQGHEGREQADSSRKLERFKVH